MWYVLQKEQEDLDLTEAGTDEAGEPSSMSCVCVSLCSSPSLFVFLGLHSVAHISATCIDTNN